MGSKLNPLFSFLAWLLTIFGAGVCLLVAVGFGGQQKDSLWPFPGLYLLEIILVGAAVVASLTLNQGMAVAFWNAVPWVAGGILLAFVVLGGFSIGPYLLPAMLAFLLVGVIVDLRGRRRIAMHLGLAMIATLLQGGLVMVLIGFVH
jgi:hypothetical protein